MQKGQELITAHCPLLLVYGLRLRDWLITIRKQWVYLGAINELISYAPVIYRWKPLTQNGEGLNVSDRRWAMKYYKIVILLLLLIFIPALSLAWSGKVVGVADGDTIEVMHDGKGEKIRLYGIDCPEKKQDFGQRAKKYTSENVFGKVVEVEAIDTDRYGRTVGLVHLGNKYSLNEALIASGYAWVYKQYCGKPRCKEWLKVELEARNKKIGLWSIPDPTPPWEFRHKKKVSGASK